MRKKEVGYIASISLAPGGVPGTPQLRVVEVMEEPGSTAEVLHTQGGLSLYRASRVVHATYEEALEDAERRIREIRR